MSHFAQINENNVVTQVIVAEQEFIDSGAVGDPAKWIQTSYNTYGGVHRAGGTPLRKNYAGIGYIYDAGRDAFISPRPYPSWTLEESSCLWIPPFLYPETGGPHRWNETNQAWEQYTPITE
jgi:hypothetical protein